MSTVQTVVVGAGHAGLAVSKLLTDRGSEHVILERSQVAASWRHQRWDSFTLLSPNWASWLPGWRYDGPDPFGFMDRDEVVDYFQRYADSFGANVREGVEVTEVSPAPGGGFSLSTSAGKYAAENVVIATGPFQSPKIPDWKNSLPTDIRQIHSSHYRDPDLLPEGAVLVVGAGPSGQQIADDLRRAGRKVYLAVGRHQRVPRRYRGRDYYWWYELGGFYEKTADELPPNKPRGAGVAPVLTGYNGGHDLDLRELATRGVVLLGRATGYQGGAVTFRDDLRDSLAAGDQAYENFTTWVEDRLSKFGGLYDDVEPRAIFPDPAPAPTDLVLASHQIRTVVWATGFQPDFSAWIQADIFDEDGFPRHRRGVTEIPGLFFMGLPWQHRLRSPFIRGAEEDATYVVSQF